MITVFAEHFLSPEGREYFPDWITELQEELRFFDGFQSIEHIRDLQNRDRCLLFLKFDKVEHLRSWAQSRIHAGFIKKLEAFRERKHFSQVLCSAQADDFEGF